MYCKFCGCLNIPSKKYNFTYYFCTRCGLVFLDKQYLLKADAEKKRYLLHNNNFNDLNYRNFLKKLFDAISPYLEFKMYGLDFGCGQNPVLADIFVKSGFNNTSFYDPHFQNNKNLLSQKYDFIVASETIEHFYEPKKEFDLLVCMLNKNGFLGIMTSILYNNIDMENWYYKNDPTHVAFYKPETFEWIARNYNLEIIKNMKNIIIFRKN